MSILIDLLLLAVAGAIVAVAVGALVKMYARDAYKEVKKMRGW